MKLILKLVGLKSNKLLENLLNYVVRIKNVNLMEKNQEKYF